MSTGIKLIGIAVILLTACTQHGPQRPSRRMSEQPAIDSAQLALMELNQRLAMSADQQLANYAQAQKESYAIYEENVWLWIIDRGNEDAPTPLSDEEWTVHMKIYNLSEQLLLDTEGTYHIGKGELPKGIDANLKELHRGGKARALVPWYSGYGVKGCDAIAPYENVLIEFELK